MRLSDILKKIKGEAIPSVPDAYPLPHLPSAVKSVFNTSPVGTIPAESPLPQMNSHPAEDAYTKAIIEIRDIFACVQKGTAYNKEIESVPAIIELIIAGNNDILVLADRSTPDVYLYGHSVNVCILSIMLGNALQMDTAALKYLGTAALLHDQGLAKNMALVLKSGKLTPAEIAQVRRHSIEGARQVALMSSLIDEKKEMIVDIILQVHERKNGSGYPAALKGEDISSFGQVIAIADVYESMSHPRPYHERAIPHEVLKSMVASTEYDFDTEVMKAFIGVISLYPPGSYVKLNTEEIARVVGVNRGLPTRPKIKVLIGPDLGRSSESKIIDLASTPMIFIKEAVDELKLNLPDKKLSLELKAVRWWVKGL